MSSRVYLHPEITDNRRHVKKCTTLFFRKLCIPVSLVTVILRLTDTSIITDQGNLKPVTPDNPITFTKGIVVRESYYPITFGTAVDMFSDVRRLRISRAMVGIPEYTRTPDISDSGIFS